MVLAEGTAQAKVGKWGGAGVRIWERECSRASGARGIAREEAQRRGSWPTQLCHEGPRMPEVAGQMGPPWNSGLLPFALMGSASKDRPPFPSEEPQFPDLHLVGVPGPP